MRHSHVAAGSILRRVIIGEGADVKSDNLEVHKVDNRVTIIC
jgi:hypothetical protein